MKAPAFIGLIGKLELPKSGKQAGAWLPGKGSDAISTENFDVSACLLAKRLAIPLNANVKSKEHFVKIFRYLIPLMLISASTNAAVLLSENFNDISTLNGNGWVLTNNSSPGGITNWFQGNTGVFSAYEGSNDSYIAANFENAAMGGNISNWLLTPVLMLNNGDRLSFFTQAAGDGFYDGLEIRFSDSGSSSNVGSSDSDIGDFTELLLSIDTDSTTGFSSGWVSQTLTFSNLSAPVTGRIGFRYVVNDTFQNGNYIGIDSLTVSSADRNSVPEPNTLFCLGIGFVYLLRLTRWPSHQSTLASTIS